MTPRTLRLRAALAVALVAPAAPGLSGGAGAAESALTSRRPVVSWTAEPVPGAACATALDTCHVQQLSVAARRGTLVTVQVEAEGWALHVVGPDGEVVARDNDQDPVDGPSEQTETDDDRPPT